MQHSKQTRTRRAEQRKWLVCKARARGGVRVRAAIFPCNCGDGHALLSVQRHPSEQLAGIGGLLQQGHAAAAVAAGIVSLCPVPLRYRRCWLLLLLLRLLRWQWRRWRRLLLMSQLRLLLVHATGGAECL